MKLTWRYPHNNGELGLIYAGILAAWAGVAWLRLFFHLPMPPCLFHYFTGIPCAGCGSTRAASALMQLRIAEALAWNPLTTVAMIGVALYCAWTVAGHILRLPLPHLEITADDLRWGVALAGFLLAANWAYLIWAGV